MPSYSTKRAAKRLFSFAISFFPTDHSFLVEERTNQLFNKLSCAWILRQRFVPDYAQGHFFRLVSSLFWPSDQSSSSSFSPSLLVVVIQIRSLTESRLFFLVPSALFVARKNRPFLISSSTRIQPPRGWSAHRAIGTFYDTCSPKHFCGSHVPPR